jgi:ABC-2 type transport system ATP-binding protein
MTLGDEAGFDEVRAALEQLPSVSTTESDRSRLTITAIAEPGSNGVGPLREISSLVADRNWDVASLQLEGGRLDEVFRQITRGMEA